MNAEAHPVGGAPVDSLLWRAWQRTVRRGPDRVAIIEAGSGAQCTLAELDRRAADAADRWLSGVVCRSRPMVFAAPNGIRWFELYLALVRAGAVAVPLDASEPLAGQRQHAETLRGAAWWDGERFQPLANARRFRDAEISFVKLTSGSTGQPRPLVFTGAQLLADARQVTTTMGIRRVDTNYAIIPLGHSYGLGNLTIPLLAYGIPIVCGSAPLPHAVAADFARWRPTVFPGVPAFWRALVAADVSADAFASLKLAISAGAPLPPDVAGEFANRFGRPLHNFYGSSETGGIAFDRTGKATLAGGVGTPIRDVRWMVSGGRLRVCSPAVFTRGNARRSGANGCWVPPDRVARDRNRGLTLLGRRGSTVKLGGRRLSLTEVLVRIRRLPGVQDAWVGVSDAAEPILGAVVVSSRPTTDLRAQLHAESPAWKVPKKWARVAEWPLTARGKMDTRALRDLVFGRRG